MDDKVIEKKRYDKKAQILLKSNSFAQLNTIPLYLNSPYEYYFKLFKNLNKKIEILEIGSGVGQNTSRLLDMSFKVCATDISSASVKIMNKKFSKYKNFSSKVADMEHLPFDDHTFDVICMAGSLSYGDNQIVMNEIYKVLKPDGIVIIVDSLNNNPIYQFNRYIRYLLNKRSKSTLKRIPDINLIEKYMKKFGSGKVKYFGSITWVFPLLRLILSDKSISNLSNWIDLKFNIKKSAFKFVLRLNKINY